jgi:ribosomal-protein-alanine N-acetyltransferase
MQITILPPSVEYASSYHRWRNEATTLRFNPVKDRNLEELTESLRISPASLMPLEQGVDHRWFINCDGQTVGTVSLSDVNKMMGTAVIGYMIGEDFHGRGIATQAVKLWTSMIFDLTDIRRLTASVAEQNYASLRVLEKVGYKREGLLREHFIIQGTPTNQIVFGLLRSEWG